MREEIQIRVIVKVWGGSPMSEDQQLQGAPKYPQPEVANGGNISVTEDVHVSLVEGLNPIVNPHKFQGCSSC